MLSTLSNGVRRQLCRRFLSSKADKKPIISCKRSAFDHYQGQTYKKFDGIPLASENWLHPKSKGDHFTIYLNVNKPDLVESIEDKLESKTFHDIGVSPPIVEILDRRGIKTPTQIQITGIRSILKGNNTVLTAETGCGKTLAYLLPILQNVVEWKKYTDSYEFNSPLAVIIAPSRELTIQVGQVAQDLGKYFDLNITTLLGGHTKRKIINPPVEYCDIMVTTLGAFSKLVTTGIYKIHNVHHVVLDEADTLLDDSFIEKLQHLMKKFSIQVHTPPEIPPKGCQLTLVSATMPRELPEQVCSFVNPDSLKMLTTSHIHRLLPHVPQKFLRLGKAQKSLELLKQVTADVNAKRPVMIFSNKAETCHWVSQFLNESNINSLNINGKMPADTQQGIYQQYLSGKVNVLSCTDIASRGLDTSRTQHVINFDFPLYMADYIHRCGRTGRLGGCSGCFVTNFVAWPREIALVKKIEMSVRKHEPLPSVDANINRLISERITRDMQRMETAA